MTGRPRVAGGFRAGRRVAPGLRRAASVTRWAMHRLDVTTTLCADRHLAVLAIAGVLDLGTADAFWPDLERLLNTHAGDAVYLEDPLDAVVLDATSLEFLDSSGLRVLLRGARLARGDGTDFRLVAPHPAVRRVLELAGAFRALDVRPSLREALA